MDVDPKIKVKDEETTSEACQSTTHCTTTAGKDGILCTQDPSYSMGTPGVTVKAFSENQFKSRDKRPYWRHSRSKKTEYSGYYRKGQSSLLNRTSIHSRKLFLSEFRMAKLEKAKKTLIQLHVGSGETSLQSDKVFISRPTVQPSGDLEQTAQISKSKPRYKCLPNFRRLQLQGEKKHKNSRGRGQAVNKDNVLVSHKEKRHGHGVRRGHVSRLLKGRKSVGGPADLKPEYYFGKNDNLCDDLAPSSQSGSSTIISKQSNTKHCIDDSLILSLSKKSPTNITSGRDVDLVKKRRGRPPSKSKLGIQKKMERSEIPDHSRDQSPDVVTDNVHACDISQTLLDQPRTLEKSTNNSNLNVPSDKYSLPNLSDIEGEKISSTAIVKCSRGRPKKKKVPTATLR